MKLIYQMFAKLLSWTVLHARSNNANEIEILVLRHQLTVLQRRTPRPRISWTDRAVLAALARLLPARRRRGFLVAPAAILRWHRHLVRRRWTTQSVRAGRPAIPAGVPLGPTNQLRRSGWPPPSADPVSGATRPPGALAGAASGREAWTGWVSGHDAQTSPERDRPTRLRVTVAGTAGLVVAILMGTAVGWRYAAAAGWTVAAALEEEGWTAVRLERDGA